MHNRSKDRGRDGASDCSKPPQVKVGRSRKIGNMFRKGKRAVQDYAKVSNTGVETEGRESLCEEREIKLKKLLASAKPDELGLIWIQCKPIGRHPEVQVSRESVNAASKSKLSRGWAMDKSLYIISI